MASSFDRQAGSFDRRAGFPDSVCRHVSATVVELVPPGGWLVEIGAGTGQLARYLATARPYLALDLSLPMLQILRQRLPAQRPAGGLQADARLRWPLRDGCASAVFGSRSFHRLDSERLLAEALRVGRPDGFVLLEGRLRRDHGGLRSRLRRRLHELLGQRGLEGLSPFRSWVSLLDAACREGGKVIERLLPASWPVQTTPRECLQSWRSHADLGGLPLERETREEILRELEMWAARTLGPLDEVWDEYEQYVLRGIRWSEKGHG